MSTKQKVITAALGVFFALGVVYLVFFAPPPPAQAGGTPPDAAVPIRHIPAPPPPLPVDDALYIAFSHGAGFYDASFYLTLTAPEGAEIFFTLDGSYPSVNATRFTEPLFVYAPSPAALNDEGWRYSWNAPLVSQVTLFTIRAVAVRGDTASEIATRNFVMGTDVFERFCENTLIFALTSDPHGLFDHYEGILVAGIDRQRWREDFTRRHGRSPIYGYENADENPSTPANFNRRGRESEREAHVEMFDHTGEVHISQRIGIRVRGGFTRAVEAQKSLELYARREYGDAHRFYFPFFADEFDARGNLVERYRRVRLRNGGTDRHAGFIRDELSQTLFRQAGQSTTQTHRPAAVFLNGEYYGPAWLKSPRTENHLERLFGGETDQFVIIEGGERRDSSWWSGDPAATSEFSAVHRLAVQGFTGTDGERRFQEFQQRVDLDALIRYYAMQIYINNLDWPNHNIEFWRYNPTAEELNDRSLHPYLRDGRWRVFVHDVESGWAIWDNDDRRVTDDTIHYILTGTGPGWNTSGSSAFLHAFLSRDDLNAQLANTFVDLIEGAFAPANVIRTLDELAARIRNEHVYAMKADAIYPGNIWWPSPHGIADNHNAIRRFAEMRPAVIQQSVTRHMGFDWNQRRPITLTVGANGTAVMNARPVASGETVTGNYFANTEIRITAHPRAGFMVEEWLVNGVRHTGPSITVSGEAEVSVRFRRI